MKKTLIALAALAATGAFAQSSVSITGTMDAGLKGTSSPATSATSSPSNTSIGMNNSATSALAFSGTEDMGGGLKASFLMEMNPNIVQSTTMNSGSSANAYTGTPFTGQQFLGLAGGFGTVKMGVVNAGALIATGMSGPFGTAMGGGYGGTTTFNRLGTAGFGINSSFANGGRIIRHEKTIDWASPKWGGFSMGAQYAFGNDNSTAANAANSDSYIGVTLQYSNGPLNAIYSYSNERFGANPFYVQATAIGAGSATASPASIANSDVAYHVLAGNYTFGPATVYAGYTSTKHNANIVAEDASSWNIAGKYALSAAIDLSGNYLVRTSNLDPLKDKALANNGSVIGLGADYKLSKRTALYARYETVNVNTDGKFKPPGAPGSVTNAYAFGVRHSF